MLNISKRRKLSEKIVNDTVHGIIKLPVHILEIVDTAPFQRLRWISQMAFTQFVYPTSRGSRFEHSIGTFHLASQLMEQIQNQIKEDQLKLDLTNIEVKCVEIAALCHDLGHGPYSHSWEHEVIPFLDIEGKHRKTHENLSCEILSDMLNEMDVFDNSSLRNSKIKDVIGLDKDHIDLIKRIILGKYQPEKDNKKRFLFEIVANKDSGLDVDKFDYLCRDTIHLGWSNKNKIHDIRRIIHFFRVMKDDKNDWRLAVKDKEIFNIHDIFYSRHMLHRYACQHKTVQALECMFKDAMKRIIVNDVARKELIDSVIGEKKPEIKSEDFYKKAVLHSKEFISKACDFHIWNIMNKYTKDIVKKIHERNLYRLYSQIKIDENGNMEDAKTSTASVSCQTNDHTKEKRNKRIDEKECAKRLEEVLNDSFEKRKINNPVKVILSVFSLSSERGKDPIYNIPIYQRETIHKCRMYDNINNKPPKLADLTPKEFVLMIFTEFPVENKLEKSILKESIKTLCTDLDVKSASSVFVDLRKSFRFTNMFDFE